MPYSFSYLQVRAGGGRLHRRLHSHLFGLSGNKHLANAVKKYGLDNFAFILLEIIPGNIDSNRNKDLLALENKYIKSLTPKYNKTPNAGNTLGYTHKPTTIIKMKNNYSPSLAAWEKKDVIE